MVPNFLNLPELTILSVKEGDHDFHVEAETATASEYCTTCWRKNLVGFGKRWQLFNDLPREGKRVGININRQRYKCKDCNVTFSEAIPAIHDKHLATKRLVKFVEKESMRRTFASVSVETGIDEKTVRRIFRTHAEYLDKSYRFEMPTWMGIDEIHIIKKPRCVITNVQHNTIVNMFPNREKKALTEYLKALPNKERIRFVAMDMWRPYKDTVKALIPKAQIVVDKFHVVRMGSSALEMHRKAIRRSLNSRQRVKLMHDRFILLKRPKDLTDEEKALMEPWFKALPTLGLAYALKEEFFGIWDSSSRSEAESAFREWKSKITFDVEKHFQPIVTAFSNWDQEIFAYFDQPITNAYTESLNNLIRLLNRNGRGYSFDALRAKVLYTEGTHDVVIPTHRAASRSIDSMSLGMGIPEVESPGKNYGAFIPSVVEALKQDLRE